MGRFLQTFFDKMVYLEPTKKTLVNTNNPQDYIENPFGRISWLRYIDMQSSEIVSSAYLQLFSGNCAYCDAFLQVTNPADQGCMVTVM